MPVPKVSVLERVDCICVSTKCLFNGYVNVAGSAVRTKQEKHREGAPAEVG